MSRNFNSCIQISLGFLLLILWFSVVNGLELLIIVLGAAMVHELGHLWMLHCFKAKVSRIRIGLLGAVLEADCTRLSYGRELAVVLAGPGANLLCAWLLSVLGDGMETAIGAHLILGAFNLLPLRPLDGGRAVYLLTAWGFGPWAGDRAARWTGTISALFLSWGLSWVMLQTGGSLWLLPPAVATLGSAIREWFGNEVF